METPINSRRLFWMKTLKNENPQTVLIKLTTIITSLNWNSTLEDDFCQELIDFCQAFLELIVFENKISQKFLRKFEEIITKEDIKLLLFKQLHKHLIAGNISSDKLVRNVSNLLQIIPSPTQKNRKYVAYYFKASRNITKQMRIKKMRLLYQNVWLKFLKLQHSNSTLNSLLPFVAENVLIELPEPQFLADFLMSCYNLGGYFSVLALSGVYTLIVMHNFDYPDFYNNVYNLTTYHVCYSEKRQKFFDLLDLFLSSTHLPAYVVAGFIKRLATLSLLAPIECQEPILMLIRNLLIRHPTTQVLLNRDDASMVDKDPYIEDEMDLAKCNAINSSLWEIKTLKNHWNLGVCKRAEFIDKDIARLEGFSRWKNWDEIWKEQINRKLVSKNSDDMETDENPYYYLGIEQKGKIKSVAITFKKPDGLFDDFDI